MLFIVDMKKSIPRLKDPLPNEQMESKEYKVRIPRWGEMELEAEEWLIIQHPAFQRLQHIRQLGLAYLTFPQAVTRRYEHCIAVGHLAGVAARALSKRHPEKKISSHDVLLTKIGGLCHDLGHGPFSHSFDDYLEQCQDDKIVKRHEDRSCLIVAWILKQHPETFTDRDIRAIQCVIDPKNYPCPEDFPTFFTEIVSNDRHGLDVDRLEYISREKSHLRPCLQDKWDVYILLQGFKIEDNHWECEDWNRKQVARILEIRSRLYREFYHHPMTEEVSRQFCRVLVLADPVLEISETCRLETDKQLLHYISFTDQLLRLIQCSTDPQLRKAQEMAVKIRPHYA
jgi:HD superfamily phosphohydrolase